MKIRADDTEWLAVLQAAQTLAQDCPDAVFIGGLAVYLHTQNFTEAVLPVSRGSLVEFSHDVDSYISLHDLAGLRDLFVVTANPRLRKHQVIIGRIEADLYVEHNHDLKVPYDELRAYALEYGPLRAAAVGHLLVLKLDAAADRSGTPKGDKDQRDLAKLALLASEADRALLEPYLDAESLARLQRIGAAPQTFMLITRGNAMQAKQLRIRFNEFVETLRER